MKSSLQFSYGIIAAVSCAAMSGAPVCAFAGTQDWIEQKVSADDASLHSGFGRAAVVVGDIAFVGVPNEQGPGSVYVFKRSGGTWTQTQKLTPTESPAGADFGYSIAANATTAIIGAPFTTLTNDGNRHQGAAYVFTNDGGTWTQSQELIAGDFAAENQFGNSVAISGDTILIAAYNAQIGENPYQGAAYIFTGSGGTWTQAQKLVASDGAGGDDFGSSVAMSGTTAFIGAPYAAGANSQQGAAYIFTSTDGLWSEQQRIVADDGQSFDDFGAALAFDGTTAAIGANYAGAGEGAVYLFTNDGDSWTQAQTLSPNDSGGSDDFAVSVAVDGATIVAGAAFATIGDNFGQGAAYVFTGAGSDWAQTAKLVADDGAASDFFGYAVAVGGNTALIGSPFNAVGGLNGAGAAYFFTQPLPDLIFGNGFENP